MKKLKKIEKIIVLICLTIMLIAFNFLEVNAKPAGVAIRKDCGGK